MKTVLVCKVCGRKRRCKFVTHYPKRDRLPKDDEPTYLCPYGLVKNDPEWGLIDKAVFEVVE